MRNLEARTLNPLSPRFLERVSGPLSPRDFPFTSPLYPTSLRPRMVGSREGARVGGKGLLRLLPTYLITCPSIPPTTRPAVRLEVSSTPTVTRVWVRREGVLDTGFETNGPPGTLALRSRGVYSTNEQ